ncbi:p53-induced protein with a death domain [Leucoagaricus sp. SymC.cos]|nr:p53-induced protein with a death domain [Leucoagaricus sp. SymC.cos]
MSLVHRSAYTPTFSSPASSPSLCVDSSPLSSPSLDPIHLDSSFELERIGKMADPFAGSFNATKSPPQYEEKQRRQAVLLSPPSTPKRARQHQDMGDEEHHFDERMPLPLHVQASQRRERTAIEKEIEEWDQLDDDIFQQQMRVIDVSDRHFTHIPENIIQTIKALVSFPAPDDLATLEMTKMKAGHRAFVRSQTAPASSAGFSRAFGERTRSVNVSSMHGMKDGIHLVLSNNLITKLPRTLWDLERLTVLSLRGNQLTVLPSEICHLRNLEDLNIANNKLQYVPSELLSMSLRVLNLHPNPFRPPPNSDAHPVSATETLILDRVLPLTEALYRVLVSPAPSTLFLKGNSDSVLSAYHDLPLPPTWFLPPRISEILDACIPNSVCQSDLMGKPQGDISMGSCGNPSHQAEGRIFVRPVEQRLSWEKVIAGQNTGGMVPVMWRGCAHGCLNFLKSEEGPAEAEDIEMAVDEEDGVVQQIELGGGLDELDFD